MSGTTDWQARLGRAAGFQEGLLRLIGRPFLFFKWIYPDQLTVHFGDRVEYELPRFGRRQRGSFVLSACASFWQVTGPGGEVAQGGGNEGKRQEPPALAAGTPVAGCLLMLTEPGWDLHLGLADGSSIQVLPDPSVHLGRTEIPEESWQYDIPDWELLTPDGMLLRAGPGPEWESRPVGGE